MTRVHALAAVLIALIMIGAIPAFGADFYETQLRLGAESFRAGRLQESIDYLRIANFGHLDRTVLLSEGLARLAMAESAAGRKDELQKTLTRFVAIERQYPSWANAAMDGTERAAFEKLLLATMPVDAIASVPSLAHLATPTAADEKPLTPEQRRRQLEAKAAAEPSNPEWPLALAREAQERNDSKAALRWAEKALKADAGATEARAIRLSIFSARKDDKSALVELQAMPESAWSEFAGVVPDAFVVFVRTKNFERAGALAPRLTEEELARADVAGAMRSWRAWEAQQTEELHQPAGEVPAATASSSTSAAAPPSVGSGQAAGTTTPPPVATPLGGPDVVDARTGASRGSFTGEQDRIGTALASAKKLMNANRPVDAQKVLRDELARSPGSRELRLAMLEASCLARDWRTGDAQLGPVQPFRNGEDRYRFYAAVVLYETGKGEEAKPLMAAAAPKLASSPFVDHYVEAVLGKR